MRCYIADAFTKTIFKGNPAAICILDEWIDDELMQNITNENKLSETAFAVKTGAAYHLRWFTPGGEIDLCGHATLATAFVLHRFYEPEATSFKFDTLSGQLTVTMDDGRFIMNFPSYDLTPVEVTDAMISAIGVTPVEAYMGRDLVCILENENQVINLKPDLAKIKQLDGELLHVTAQGTQYDTISRSFAPKLAVDEDPVCGSGHCHIIPLWAHKLKQAKFTAYQASARSGVLYCEYLGDRTTLAGDAALYSIADLQV